jgi:hypothetical protein
MSTLIKFKVRECMDCNTPESDVHADGQRSVPIDVYMTTSGVVTLCLGDVALRRAKGEYVQRSSIPR